MWDSAGHRHHDGPPMTRTTSGDLLSPFDSNLEAPSYSSSEEEFSEEEHEDFQGYLLTEGLADVDSMTSSTWVVNNSVGSWEGSLPSQNHPQSLVERIETIAAMSFSQNNVASSGIDDLVRELERLGAEGADSLGRGGKYSELGGRSKNECHIDSTQKQKHTQEHTQERTQMGDDKSGDASRRTSCPSSEDSDQESLSWLSSVQVNWQQIGQGSFGRVFRASIGDQVYALKVVEASRKCQLRKLASEARANMMLKHENVVTCYRCCALTNGSLDQSSTQDPPLELWMLQELCEGGTLDEAIRRPWMYPPGNDAASRQKILMDLSTQIAKGLGYIHSRGHIHGDLSSNNVLLALPRAGASLTAQGQEDSVNNLDVPPSSDPRMWENVTLKISDFGRCKGKEFGSCRTDSIGTVTFMPPETLTTGSLQPSSDMYSYGIVLIQLWTGKLPYQEYNFAQIIFEASQGRTPEVPEDMDAPDLVKTIIRQCISPLSSDRPTATEVLGMLHGVTRISVAEDDDEDEQ